jgi:hypothetical protein
MVDRNPIISQFLGTTIGAIQTPLLREYVDTANPFIGGIGAFGRPSALVGMISGLFTLGLGIYGSMKKNGGQRFSDSVVLGFIGHGTVALETGVLSGLLPAPKTATVSGMSGVMESPYIPPQSMGGGGADMSMLNSMSAELNRLQAENMNLRNMQAGTYPAAIPQGSVVDKQYRYGFMEPTPQEYIAPGQPTKAAREFGFMERGGGINRNPLVKVQNIASRSGFLG